MTDRELNRKLAELCGRELVDSSMMGGRWLLADPPTGCVTVWNPCGDWGQVHEYVIPALQRACDVTIGALRDAGSYVVIERPHKWCVRRTAVGIGAGPSPRFVCQAALEAAKKLEAAT